MKKMIVAVALLTSFCALAQTPTAQRPEVKVGELSTYRTVDLQDRKETLLVMTVTEVKSDDVQFAWRNTADSTEGKILYTRDMNPYASVYSGAQYSPHAQLLSFPLSVGQEWKQTNAAKATNGSTSKFDLVNKVTAWEKVKTPAGEFDAFKIEGKGWLNGVSWQGSMRVVQVNWYAPAAGRIVRQEYQLFRGSTKATDVLSELTAQKPAP
jgi:hypothetical protein